MNNLRLLQLLQLKTLIDLSSFCDNLKLDYFIVAGTLLGAKRHRGFIPWDHDIDIAMPRESFNVLRDNLSYLPEYYDVPYDIYSKESKSFFLKIRLKDTVFIENGNNLNIKNNGIYIDIFPLDNYDNEGIIKQKILFLLYRVLCRIKSYKAGKHKSVTAKGIFFSKYFLPILSFVIPTTLINYLHDGITQRGSNESIYLNNYNSKYGLKRQCFKREVYYPSTFLKFEGYLFRAPNDFVFWLTQIYGNFEQTNNYSIAKTENLLELYQIDFGPFSELINFDEKTVRSMLFK